MCPSSRRMCIFCTQRTCIYTFCAKVPHFFVRFCCRTPQGVRGLKWMRLCTSSRSSASHPARGAWIEICILGCCPLLFVRRAPQGARGLKSVRRDTRQQFVRSRPARGAWIEIGRPSAVCGQSSSRPARGAAKESPILFSGATCGEENISRPATVRAAGRQVFRQNHTWAVIDRPGSLYSRGRVPRCARQICSSTSLASWYAMSAL